METDGATSTDEVAMETSVSEKQEQQDDDDDDILIGRGPTVNVKPAPTINLTVSQLIMVLSSSLSSGVKERLS